MNNTKQIKALINEIFKINDKLDTDILEYFEEFNYYKHIDSFAYENDIEDNSESDAKLDKANSIFEYIEEKNAFLLIQLNNLLEDKEKDSRIINLEQQMKKIQSKKYITVSEFEKIYNISKSSQKGLRARLNDPLPFQQKLDDSGNRVSGGKITYIVEEVEKWMDNNYR